MNDLDQIQTIDDYFGAFGRYHVQKATQLLQPLAPPAEALAVARKTSDSSSMPRDNRARATNRW